MPHRDFPRQTPVHDRERKRALVWVFKCFDIGPEIVKETSLFPFKKNTREQFLHQREIFLVGRRLQKAQNIRFIQANRLVFNERFSNLVVKGKKIV